MYSILIVIHVIISLFLIAVILLQAGKGGGLADSFGGSQMQNMFGTKSATVLTRLTAVCAIGFIATCISLAVISSHQARSIVDNVRIPQPQVPASAEPIAPQGGANEVK
ncbi:MAG: preprotein translocase subunit SecG [Candidatus Omnitrophota bacterium]|nr:preprotein translocase subunit SecG [Candidatus Omnitrophota bacterium]